MNYIYWQYSGRLELTNGEFIGTGYSGKEECKNNPNKQDVKFRGPIPRGWYTIEGPFDSEHKGPCCFHLVPDKTNEMFNRCDFEIHGDSIDHPGKASDGCIIQNRATRIFIEEHLKDYNRLRVV